MTTQTDLLRRTPQEVFTHHVRALEAGDLDDLMLDYADTATFILPSGVLRGKDAIRQFFGDLVQALPKPRLAVKTVYSDNALLIEWTADSTRASVSDGVDTFLFESGLIALQTVHCTLVPKAQRQGMNAGNART